MLSLLEMHPLSDKVLAVLTDEGWRLSNGHSFTTPYATFAAALADRDAFRRLTFDEKLLNLELGEAKEKV